MKRLLENDEGFVLTMMIITIMVKVGRYKRIGLTSYHHQMLTLSCQTFVFKCFENICEDNSQKTSYPQILISLSTPTIPPVPLSSYLHHNRLFWLCILCPFKQSGLAVLWHLLYSDIRFLQAASNHSRGFPASSGKTPVARERAPIQKCPASRQCKIFTRNFCPPASYEESTYWHCSERYPCTMHILSTAQYPR